MKINIIRYGLQNIGDHPHVLPAAIGNSVCLRDLRLNQRLDVMEGAL
jgi:hypothetical protein